jgi:hypothetical protein
LTAKTSTPLFRTVTFLSIALQHTPDGNRIFADEIQPAHN